MPCPRGPGRGRGCGCGEGTAPWQGRAGQTATGPGSCPAGESGRCGQGGTRSANKCDSGLGLLVLPVCGGDAGGDASGDAGMPAWMQGCWQGCRQGCGDASGDAGVPVGMLTGMRASPLPVLLQAAPPPPGSRAGPAPSPSGCPLPGPLCPMTTSPCCPKQDAPVQGFAGPATGCGPQGGSPRSAEEEPQLFQAIRCLPDASLDVQGHPWGGLTRKAQGWGGRHSAVPWGSTGRDTQGEGRALMGTRRRHCTGGAWGLAAAPVRSLNGTSAARTGLRPTGLPPVPRGRARGRQLCAAPG